MRIFRIFIATICFELFVMVLCWPNQGYGQRPLKFSRFSTNNGLSQSNVTCILQDKMGFMWFGTQNGLNKYDGYQITIFRHDPTDTNSISNNYIRAMVEDSTGDLWIGTWGGGLVRYIRKQEKFTHYLHTPAANSLSDNFVSGLQIDRNGKLWIGTENGGLNTLDPATGAFSTVKLANHLKDGVTAVLADSRGRIWVALENAGLILYDPHSNTTRSYANNPANDASIAAGDIRCLMEDRKHRIWVGTDGSGLNLYENGSFRRVTGIPGDVIFSIAEDPDGQIWIGTENDGLAILAPNSENFRTITHDDMDNSSLGSNSIYALYKDRQDNMWVGTYSGGVNLYNRGMSLFTHYKRNSGARTLSNNAILAFAGGDNGKIWVATDGGGVDLFDPQTGDFQHFLHRETDHSTIGSDYIPSLCIDHHANLWVGTVGSGIDLLDRRGRLIKVFKNRPSDSSSLIGNNISALAQDSSGNIWIGAYGNGLDVYKKGARRFIHYSRQQGAISSNHIRSLFGDSKGNLWIGTFDKGVDVFDAAQNRFRHYAHSDAAGSISDDNINTFLEDDAGNIWIGTNFGLNYFDCRTGKFTAYFIRDGLPDNSIMGIVRDDNGDLWVSTLKGVAHFIRPARSFRNYSIADGLQGDEFKPGAAFKDRSGVLYFGGSNGFNAWNPDSMRESNFDPPLVFTKMQLSIRDVRVARSDADNSPLKQDISSTREIVLPYSNSIITFEFATLNYTISRKKVYAYRLVGFDKVWNESGTRHTATYTNLDAGHYTFIVRGSDNTGSLSSHELSVKLVILPPYWQTWWFRSLCVIGVAALLFAFYRAKVLRIRKRHAILEKLVKERTQEAETANRAKSAFLATMSHEIRTPLNGVIGMSTLLSHTVLTTEQTGYANTILSCGESLMSVINDILDFSKIEAGNMELDEREFDLQRCIEDVLDVFSVRVSDANIDLVYEIEPDAPVRIVGDEVRLKQVLMNLVGNAVKFTKKGEVCISVRNIAALENGDVRLEFVVRDTGVGIAPEKLDRLFKAFSQADSSITRQYGGTGLGLVICEKLIALMHGAIGVSSTPGQGTAFKFDIRAAIGVEPAIRPQTYPTGHTDPKTVLIVDDNPTNLTILQKLVAVWGLHALTVTSGADALNVLRSGQKIDLLITDHQMDGMNGIELTLEMQRTGLKIPVLLLSSSGSEPARLHPGLFQAVLNKPVRHTVLKKYIDELFAWGAAETGEPEYGRNSKLPDLAAQFDLRILIAEDYIFNRLLIESILNKLGYQPEMVENGQEAVDRVREENFDLVFMDVQMPVMDGLTASKCIRELKIKQPVIIAMTAEAQESDRQACLHAGMDDYLSKPIQLDKLINMLKAWSRSKKLIRSPF
jgi:signal transduction histidine kinase/ligand-binding sensor domain-containing protein/DNA-binding response OmpR family regulator